PWSVLAEHFAVGQCDVHKESARITVLERPGCELDLVAWFYRVRFPACAYEVSRRIHLQIPDFGAAFLVHNFDFQPRVWVGPLELFDDPFLRDRLCLIDTSGGVMSIGCDRETQRHH